MRKKIHFPSRRFILHKPVRKPWAMRRHWTACLVNQRWNHLASHFSADRRDQQLTLDERKQSERGVTNGQISIQYKPSKKSLLYASAEWPFTEEISGSTSNGAGILAVRSQSQIEMKTRTNVRPNMTFTNRCRQNRTTPCTGMSACRYEQW